MPDVASTVHNSITSSTAVDTGTQRGRPCTGNSNQMTQTYLVARLPKNPTGRNGCFALLLDGLHPRLHPSIPSIFISLKLRYLWKQVKIRWNFASSPRASLLVEHVAMACYGSYVPIPQRHSFAVSPFPWEGVIHLISKSERGSLLYYQNLGPRYWYCHKTTVKNDWSSCKLSRSSSI